MSETPPSLEEQLATAARESARDDELLERLAAAQLTPAERLELERRASSDPALRQAIELCQPLPVEAREQLVRRLGGNVISLESRRSRRWVVGGLALAATLTAVVLPKLLSPGEGPHYTLEASGDALVRSTPSAGPLTVSRESRLTLVARPARSVPPPSRVLVSVSPAGTLAFHPLEVDAERSPEGAVRVVLDGAKVGPPGAYLLRLELGEGTEAVTLETSVELTP